MSIFLVVAASFTASVVAVCSTRYGLIYLQIIIIRTNHLNTESFGITFFLPIFRIYIYSVLSAARQSFFYEDDRGLS